MPYQAFNSTYNLLKKHTVKLMLILTASVAPVGAIAEFEHSPYVEKAITEAMYQYDKDTLQGLSEHSENYNHAYALYRLAQLNMPSTDKTQSARSLYKAKAILENLDAPKDPEVQVLKAGVVSLLMGIEPHNAGALASELEQAFDDDKEGATLARVKLLKGINLMYTPPAYGGSIDAAANLLEEAAKNFKNAPPSKVSWGEAETYIWLGKARQHQGDLSAAKSAFEQALTIAPKCHWAAKELSQLDKT